MGRPLSAPITRVSGGWQVSLPAATGSKGKVRRTFASESDAQRWRTAAIAAKEEGRPYPEADDFRTPSPRTVSVPSTLPSLFEKVAREWHFERYVEDERAQADRAKQVLSHIENHILPWARTNGITDASHLARTQARAFLMQYKGGDVQAETLPVAPIWLTVGQAADEVGVSHTTMARWVRSQREGVGTDLVEGRRMVFLPAVRATYPVGRAVRRGPRVADGVSQDYLEDVWWTFRQILRHGIQTRVWTLAFDPDTISAPRVRRAPPGRKGEISLPETARIASHLHVVHQVAVWLMRILGLRAGEAYGLHVSDIIDYGDIGLVRIWRQGGARRVTERDRDGHFVSSPHKESLKTASSVRVLVVPRPLLVLVRQVTSR